jgi:hypothetical protein
MAIELKDIPREPWRLVATGRVSFWLLPEAEAPFAAPPGWRPVRLAGRICLGCGLLTYGPSGDLSYNELVAAVLVRRGLSLGVTIPWIWVDSAVSRDGAQGLWAIPKQMAAFEGAPAEAARVCEHPLAAVRSRSGATLPGRWPARLRVVQARGSEVVETPVRLTARVRWAEAAWRSATPLPPLGRERPLFSLVLEEAHMLFGRGSATVR